MEFKIWLLFLSYLYQHTQTHIICDESMLDCNYLFAIRRCITKLDIPFFIITDQYVVRYEMRWTSVTRTGFTGTLFALLVLYGLSAIANSYFFSFFIESTVKASVCFMLVNTLLGEFSILTVVCHQLFVEWKLNYKGNNYLGFIPLKPCNQ